jgi:hypothetical protein
LWTMMLMNVLFAQPFFKMGRGCQGRVSQED